MRIDGRENTQLRPVKITRNYMPYAEGSALIEMGGTKVVCTATVEETVPPFRKNTGEGWITAEYSMLPRATRTRNSRDISKLKLNGRDRFDNGRLHCAAGRLCIPEGEGPYCGDPCFRLSRGGERRYNRGQRNAGPVL